MVLYGEKANKERRFIDAHYFAANQRSTRYTIRRNIATIDWALKAHHKMLAAGQFRLKKPNYGMLVVL